MPFSEILNFLSLKSLSILSYVNNGQKNASVSGHALVRKPLMHATARNKTHAIIIRTIRTIFFEFCELPLQEILIYTKFVIITRTHCVIKRLCVSLWVYVFLCITTTSTTSSMKKFELHKHYVGVQVCREDPQTAWIDWGLSQWTAQLSRTTRHVQPSIRKSKQGVLEKKMIFLPFV